MAVSVKSEYSLIGIILLAGLSILAWISTYTGILELIAASTGDIGVPAKIAIAFAVFMLQLMILYILDSLFSREFYTRNYQFRKFSIVLAPLYVIGYLILFAISVGFAFGFYWKYLEAGSQTTQQAEASVGRVQEALQLGKSRLEQLQTTFTSLRLISAEKADQENTQGRTCPGSGPGDGPRRRLRDADSQRFQYASDFIGQRTASVNADINALNADLEKILQKDASTVDPSTGSRNAFIGELNRKLGLMTTRFNDLRTDPQLLQIRDEIKIRADKVTFSDERGGSFQCPDQQLQSALSGVARAIDELPELERAQLRAYEGSEAVIEAFRRLTNSGIGWSQQFAAALGGPPAQPVVNGLAERDYVPLIIAIFVDICILLVSINRPFGVIFDMTQSMRAARGSGANEFLIPFFEVAQDYFDRANPPSPQQLLNPLEDVIFDHEGEYYAAVPLDFRDPDHQLRREEVMRKLQQTERDDWFNPSSDMPLETSRYIANVYLALEGRRVVELQKEWPPNLTLQTIKRKLDEQGSVYMQANAFRLYRLNRRAWPDFVQSVVGSGADSEERLQAKRRRADGERQRSARAPMPLESVNQNGPQGLITQDDRGRLPSPEASAKEPSRQDN